MSELQLEKRSNLFEPSLSFIICVMRDVTWERISASESGSTRSYVVSTSVLTFELTGLVKKAGPDSHVVLVSSAAGTDQEP